MTDEERAKLELEVSIRGAALDEIKKISREWTELQKKGRLDLGLDPKGIEQFNEGGKRANATLTGMKTHFGDIARSLLGPVGVAAGLYAVSNQLTEFAKGQVEMKALAENTRFTTSDVSALQQAMKRLGMSGEEASSVITNLGGKLNNLSAFREGSELWKALSQSGTGGINLAIRLRGLVDAGNQMGAVTEILRTFEQQTDRAKIALSSYLGVPLSILENLSQALQRNQAGWASNMEAAERWHNQQVDFDHNLSQIWKSISGHVIDAITEITGAESKQAELAKSIAKMANDEITGVLNGIKTSIAEVKAVIEAVKSLQSMVSLSAVTENVLGNVSTAAGIARAGPVQRYRGNSGITMEALQGLMGGGQVTPGGDVQMPSSFKERWFGKDKMGGGGSDTDFSGSRRRVEIEEDSNTILRDMRDSLIRMETGAVGGSGSSGSTVYPAGQARRGILEGRRGGGSGGGAGVDRDIGEPTGGGRQRGGWWTTERQQYATNYLMENGGLPEVSARALVARFAAVESTGGGPNAINPSSKAAGIAQWLGARKHGFKMGDIDSQLNKVIREVQGKEPGEGPRSGRLLMGAKTDEEAARAATAYERAERYNPANNTDVGTAGTLSFMKKMQRGGTDPDAMAARDRIDKTQSHSEGKWGKITAAIDFLNMPHGVKQNTQFEGDVFAGTRVSVERAPQAGVAGGETAPYSPRSVQ